jgi:hypothetical protein
MFAVGWVSGMQEMADQQLKQMLLAYVLLLLHDRPLPAEELDRACEDFMQNEFSQDIDFDIRAALPRLTSWYLVQQDNQVTGVVSDFVGRHTKSQLPVLEKNGCGALFCAASPPVSFCACAPVKQ